MSHSTPDQLQTFVCGYRLFLEGNDAFVPASTFCSSLSRDSALFLHHMSGGLHREQRKGTGYRATSEDAAASSKIRKCLQHSTATR